jgi:hypothetical protein
VSPQGGEPCLIGRPELGKVEAKPPERPSMTRWSSATASPSSQPSIRTILVPESELDAM